MVRRPADMSGFEFSAVSGLRAVQLQRGCTPRVEQCEKVVVSAPGEVAARRVLGMLAAIDTPLPSSD